MENANLLLMIIEKKAGDGQGRTEKSGTTSTVVF